MKKVMIVVPEAREGAFQTRMLVQAVAAFKERGVEVVVCDLKREGFLAGGVPDIFQDVLGVDAKQALENLQAALVQKLRSQAAEADGLVILNPTYFGGAPASIAGFFEHVLFNDGRDKNGFLSEKSAMFMTSYGADHRDGAAYAQKCFDGLEQDGLARFGMSVRKIFALRSVRGDDVAGEAAAMAQIGERVADFVAGTDAPKNDAVPVDRLQVRGAAAARAGSRAQASAG